MSVREYGEVLLLSANRSKVLRANPLPGVPPQALLLEQDALYCSRAGDGGLPDSMVCRIDRSTLRSTVRIYPVEETQDDPPTLPRWTRADRTAPETFTGVARCGADLCADGARGTARFARTTLELIP